MSIFRRIRSFFILLTMLCFVGAAAFFAALFLPKTLPEHYVLKIRSGHGWSAVSRQLAADGVIYWRIPVTVTGRLITEDMPLRPGHYRFSGKMSAWRIITRLYRDGPDKISVRIPEGMTLAKIRRTVDGNRDIEHLTADWSDDRLLATIDPDKVGGSLEGRLFPDTYVLDEATDDLTLYRMAYGMMKRHLDKTWRGRDPGLPYKNAYEMLIMASIIEKETNLPEDRAAVASVFVNRLRLNMRLQTDPTVIYGMGEAYRGNIARADLQRDTPYNTYTRNGLPPTPIAAPSLASLTAAAHPAQSDYLYFVAKGDGGSHFSENLDEHNRAVKRYILKK